MTWRPGLVADETAKVRWAVVPYTRGKGLDIGCGSGRLWESSIGVDAARNAKHANLAADVRALDIIADQCMDYVYSSHCLEDLEDTDAVLREWWRVVKVGGYLVLYLPHRDHYPHIGHPAANPAHKHDFTPEDIRAAMRRIAFDWRLVECEDRSEGDEYSFLIVFQRRGPCLEPIDRLPEPIAAPRCIVLRYGGFGDVLVAGSTFAHLKEQGYHLTVVTGAKGADVLKHDPHVDRLIQCEHEHAVSRAYWLWLRHEAEKTGGKFINFAETFEGALLAAPNRANYDWPHAMRHKLMDRPYLELAHDVAEVPQEYRQKYFATQEELHAARRQWGLWSTLARSTDAVRVVVANCGTGMNKAWPGVFEFVFRLLKEERRVHVTVVGEMRGAQFITPAGAEARLHVVGETWPPRDAIALAMEADLVVGQETGILNAVAMEAMPKIVLLSHSSANNLTSHWVNAWTAKGDVPCYPCHRLHPNWAGCRRDDATGTAACQAAIAPMDVLRLARAVLAERCKNAA